MLSRERRKQETTNTTHTAKALPRLARRHGLDRFPSALRTITLRRQQPGRHTNDSDHREKPSGTRLRLIDEADVYAVPGRVGRPGTVLLAARPLLRWQ